MKILMLTWFFHPHIGGVEKHVLRVSEELVRAGFDVRVLTLRYDASLEEREVRQGIEIRRIGRHAFEGIPGLRLLHGWLSSRDAADLFAWADLIHFHDHTPFIRWYLPRLLLPGRKPVLITFHGFESQVPQLKAVLERKLLARVSARTVCVGKFIETYYGTPCDEVTVGAVDVPAGADGQRERRGLYLGRVEPDVGVFTCLEMLRCLRDRHGLEVPLDVVGSGSLLDAVRERAAVKGLDVVFHGQVADPGPYLLRALFTFASSYLSMLEAMAAKSLVVATWTSGLKRDYIESMGVEGDETPIIADDDAGRLAGRLASIIGDPGAHEMMTERAFQYASGKSWQRLARAYAGLYAEATGSGRGDTHDAHR